MSDETMTTLRIVPTQTMDFGPSPASRILKAAQGSVKIDGHIYHSVTLSFVYRRPVDRERILRERRALRRFARKAARKGRVNLWADPDRRHVYVDASYATSTPVGTLRFAEGRWVDGEEAKR